MAGADYDWSCEELVGNFAVVTAEQLLRAAWEDGPAFLRALLPVAWKYGLGLRLGSTSDVQSVLGWPVVQSTQDRVAVDADSPLLSARNIVSIKGGCVRWRTVVTYNNQAGRLLWMPAKLVHQWLVPRMLRRAIRHRIS